MKKKQPFKVLLYSKGGAGKSTSCATLLKNAPESRRIVYLMTERNAVTGLEFGLQAHKIHLKPGQLLYVFPEQKEQAFVNLTRSINAFRNESKISSLKGSPDKTQGKENYGHLSTILNSLTEFIGVDYLTGENVKIGNVAKLDEEDILVIDGLSPIIEEIWNASQGDKLSVAMSDYSTPQRILYAIFSQLRTLKCNVVLLAHEKENIEEVEIGNGKTISKLIDIRVNTSVGNANYELLMGCMTDVIRATKNQKLFKWTGSKPGIYTIARNLPEADNLDPDFSKYNFF